MYGPFHRLVARVDQNLTSLHCRTFAWPALVNFPVVASMTVTHLPMTGGSPALVVWTDGIDPIVTEVYCKDLIQQQQQLHNLNKQQQQVNKTNHQQQQVCNPSHQQ